MKGNILLILMLFSSVISYAQLENPSRIEQEVQDQFNGTFQIILADTRMIEPEITNEIRQLVSSERLQSVDVYLEIDEYTKLYIPSFDQISDENYVELELYRYE